MTATTYDTPVGPMPLTKSQQRYYGSMTNVELVDSLSVDRFIDPLALNELLHRGLARKGDMVGDIRARVYEHERRRLLFDEIRRERDRQDQKWGGPEHDDRHTIGDFVTFICQYAGWAGQMSINNARHKARRRLVQVASLAVAAVEKIDREESHERNQEGGSTISAETTFESAGHFRACGLGEPVFPAAAETLDHLDTEILKRAVDIYEDLRRKPGAQGECARADAMRQALRRATRA